MSARHLGFGLNAGACVLCAALLTAPVAAEDFGSVSAQPAQRPRIGLVLAGGGAKGGAHVGVIKVLEEQHVPIDCIAGTSMGAIIGGGYAAGLPAAEILQFVDGIDWEAVLGGVERRPLEPIEQKRLKTRTGANFELGVKNRHVVTPAGLSNTSGIDDLLRTYVAQARLVADFDQLPIPYRAVATDMVTGKMVVLDRGDLAMAMRASMAIPGAFAPVAWEKYVLADGGQVRNIPVDVARDTCADVVVVVNLVEPATPPEKLVQATQLLARSMEVMLEANENVQLATLTDRDVRIDVPMGDIGAVDFPRLSETVPLGEAAARKVADALARYSVPSAQYAAWRQGVTMRQGLEARVAEVRYEGLQQVNPEYLRSVTLIRPGDAVSIAAISNDALRMAALDDVASVAYRIDGDPANPVLVWMPEEASVGHDVLRPAMGLYAAGEGDLKFLVSGQYVRRWLNDRGGQWRSTLQLGHETLLATSVYQPFDVAQRWFVEPGLSASRSFENLYVDGEHVAEYEFRDAGGRIELGVNLTPSSQLRLGYLNTARHSEVRTGIADLPRIHARVPELDARDASLVAGFTYDSRDVATFARHGLAAELQYVQTDESLGGDRDWSRIEAGVRKGIPFGKNAVWLGLAGGGDLSEDEIPGDRAFSLGGPQTLPAYDHDELRVRGYWLANVNVLWNLADLVPVRNQIIYGGFGLQAAGLYDRIDRIEDGEVYAMSLYVGGPTPIGTFTLGVGGATDSWGVWLALGRPVGKGSILDDGLFR